MGSESEIMGFAFLGIAIAAIPLVLGFLRNGLLPFLVSLVLISVYIAILLVFDIRPRGYGLREEEAVIVVIRAYLLVTLASAVLAYWLTKDKAPESESGSFVDNHLFYQHGQMVQSSSIPINLTDEHSSSGEQQKFTDELQAHLIDQINARFSSEPTFRQSVIRITDRYLKSDTREFIQFCFTTSHQSAITHFINIQSIGDQLVVNTKIYIRSFYKWYDLLFFFATSPLTYLFWIFPLCKGYFSVKSRLGTIFQENAFDQLDMEAYIKSSSFTVLSSVEEFASKNNLMTDELQQVIVNQITNTQNITVEKSKGIRFGKISVASSAPKGK